MVLDSTECYRTFIAFSIVSSIQFHDRQIIKGSNSVIILVVSRCYCSDLLNLQNLPELSRTSPHYNKHHKSYYKSKCIKKPIYYYSNWTNPSHEITNCMQLSKLSSIPKKYSRFTQLSLKLIHIIFFIAIDSMIREIGISNQLIFI